jgi:predicted permease
MSTASLLWASAQAVAQVLLLAAVGAGLEAGGEMGAARRGGLSALAYRMLLPALLFVNIAASAPALADPTGGAWVLPLLAGVYITIGAAIGACVAGWVSAVQDEFSRAHVAVACALGNHGYIPLVLLPAVILQVRALPGGTIGA